MQLRIPGTLLLAGWTTIAHFTNPETIFVTGTRPAPALRAGLAAVVLAAIAIGSGVAAAHSGAGSDLRHFFETVDEGAPALIAGQDLHYPHMLAEFYHDRGHAPLWVEDGPLRGAVAELVRAIKDSEAHGFLAANYHGETLLSLSTGHLPIANLAVELLASDAFLRQAAHRAAGAVFGEVSDPSWHLQPPDVDPAEQLERVARREISIAAALDALWPDNDEYRALVAHRAYLHALGDPPTAQVPGGALLRPGQRDARVIALKNRLLGPGEHDELYDERLRAAVIEFQRSSGLDLDGIVGPGTLEVMNASRFSWIERIDANLERWRWLPRTLPETYIRVNAASFTLRAVEQGEDAVRMDVIVGQPYRQTPTFSAPLRYMVFNPFWNLPRRIAVQDKLPELQRDPARLTLQGFEARRNGNAEWLPVDVIDWAGMDRNYFPYSLRQRPGPENALGQVKFMLPNEHAVYLHDTPTRNLFARSERTFSSGCVRLARPMELARWLLDVDGRRDEAQRMPDILASGATEVVYLERPVATFLVYFTAIADDAGAVSFRRDLYQRDPAIVAALHRSHSTTEDVSSL